MKVKLVACGCLSVTKSTFARIQLYQQKKKAQLIITSLTIPDASQNLSKNDHFYFLRLKCMRDLL